MLIKGIQPESLLLLLLFYGCSAFRVSQFGVNSGRRDYHTLERQDR